MPVVGATRPDLREHGRQDRLLTHACIGDGDRAKRRHDAEMSAFTVHMRDRAYRQATAGQAREPALGVANLAELAAEQAFAGEERDDQVTVMVRDFGAISGAVEVMHRSCA